MLGFPPTTVDLLVGGAVGVPVVSGMVEADEALAKPTQNRCSQLKVVSLNVQRHLLALPPAPFALRVLLMVVEQRH